MVEELQEDRQTLHSKVDPAHLELGTHLLGGGTLGAYLLGGGTFGAHLLGGDTFGAHLLGGSRLLLLLEYWPSVAASPSKAPTPAVAFISKTLVLSSPGQILVDCTNNKKLAKLRRHAS